MVAFHVNKLFCDITYRYTLDILLLANCFSLSDSDVLNEEDTPFTLLGVLQFSKLELRSLQKFEQLNTGRHTQKIRKNLKGMRSSGESTPTVLNHRIVSVVVWWIRM